MAMKALKRVTHSPEARKLCPNCGATIWLSARFCDKCGNSNWLGECGLMAPVEFLDGSVRWTRVAESDLTLELADFQPNDEAIVAACLAGRVD